MKTKFLIILGIIGIGLSMALIICVLTSTNSAFPYGYPRISQNDLYCSTAWHVTNTIIDDEELVKSVQNTISEFGSHVDIPHRTITVSHNDEETVISIAGIWTDDENQHNGLTSVIKNFIGDSELIRDNMVACA